MNKNKNEVIDRLRSKILPENRIYIKKNLAISEQIDSLLKVKGWTQKDLAKRLGKTESEISRMLSGMHNLTLKTIAKLEAELENDIIVTPLQVSNSYELTSKTSPLNVVSKMNLATSAIYDDYTVVEENQYEPTYSNHL